MYGIKEVGCLIVHRCAEKRQTTKNVGKQCSSAVYVGDQPRGGLTSRARNAVRYANVLFIDTPQYVYSKYHVRHTRDKDFEESDIGTSAMVPAHHRESQGKHKTNG